MRYLAEDLNKSDWALRLAQGLQLCQDLIHQILPNQYQCQEDLQLLFVIPGH